MKTPEYLLRPRFSPMLADRVALTSDIPLEEIVDEIIAVIRG
jgi:hypothetical protein